jgi:hypothetical protein
MGVAYLYGTEQISVGSDSACNTVSRDTARVSAT